MNPLSSHPGRLPAVPGPGGRTLRSLIRHPAVLPGVAVLVAAGLLLVYHTVVTQAVNQSVLQQKARSAQAQALWRCKQLSVVSARQACLRELAAPLVSGT
ncbi:hypothetical protein [Rhodoferax fermentans]|uniref:hypothetical protein n=1 Tax=Rhodoferax fermentans TaxID=28066 RepID=UPI00117B3ACF|nr:hypothetical protein [Rhodoferax fermentans]